MTSESITVQPTWGFEFRAVLPDQQHLDSDEHEVEVDLGDPVGRVTMEARRGPTPIRPIPPGPVALRDAKEIVFTGRGYASEEEAKRAGNQVGNAVRLAATQASVDLAIGSQKAPRNRHAQPPDDKSDVPGLSIRRDGMRARASLLGTAIVLTPLPKFAEALRSWTVPGAMITPKRALACDLLAQSGFESSSESTHLTLVTALEVLGERRPRTGCAAELVDEFLNRIDAATKKADKAERAALQSLRGGAEDLRNESIGAAVRRLAAPVAITWPGWDSSTTQLVTRSYSARSELVHGGQTTHDLGQLGGPLKLLVRNLCLQQPMETEAAEPSAGTSGHDWVRWGVGPLLAKLRSAVRFIVRG
jgi:hypothetical protein